MVTKTTLAFRTPYTMLYAVSPKLKVLDRTLRDIAFPVHCSVMSLICWITSESLVRACGKAGNGNRKCDT